jgi:nicotinate-nucleotide pyrophosphorylase (carboxylating)
MDIPVQVREFLKLALEEDIGAGDITSGLLIPEDNRASAVLVAKGSFTLAGLPFAEEVFMSLDKEIVHLSLRRGLNSKKIDGAC